MTIKTFRGLIADGAQDTINLHTNDGKTGYRIVKFQALAPSANVNIESTLKIYKVSQGTIVDEIDFSDNTLLAAILITQSSSGHNYPEDQTVIFDREIFNQDIYVSLKGADYTANINYYIELEQVKLDLNETTVATLQNVREHTPYNNPT